MAGERISELPAAIGSAPDGLLPITQGYTVPGTGNTRKMTQAALMLGAMALFNVQAYGAKGNGSTDDIISIQAACDAAAAVGGGTVYFPGGRGVVYIVSMPMIVASNCTLLSLGGAKIMTTPGGSFQKSPRAMYFPPSTTNIALFVQNAKNTYPINYSDVDHNITIDGLVFDFANYGGSSGSGSALNFVGVNGLTIRNCTFYAGVTATSPTGRMGDALASIGNGNVLVQNCAAYWFRNCCYDFWSSPFNVTLDGCYGESVDAVQLANFNPDTEPSVGGYQPNQVASGFTMQNCHFVGTGANSIPIQIERLSGSSTGSYVENVLITNNVLERMLLVLRGDVRGLTIANNMMKNFPNPNTNVIRIQPNYGGTGSGVNIIGNTIRDPGTAAGQGGAILCDTGANAGLVTANSVTGTGYTGEPFGQGTTGRPNQFGNYFELAGITGRIHQGFILTNPNDSVQNPRSCYGWEDTSGGVLRMYMAGDFWGFYSTDGSGNARQIASLQAHSATSYMTWLTPHVFGALVRIGISTGLTATGSLQSNALALTQNNNEVTTVASGTGVLLPAGTTVSNSGLEITIWNQGANPLKVYPPTSAQIDGLGLNVPEVIYPGARKSYEGISSALYRSKSGNVLAPSQVANAAGTTQGTAAQITGLTTYLTTDTITYGGKLPLAKAGLALQIRCTGTEDLVVWPATGETIYGTAGANTPISVTIDTGILMTCFVDGTWFKTAALF